MGFKIVYEEEFFASGWFTREGGLTPQSWYDRELSSNIDDGHGGGGGGVIPLFLVDMPFLDDPDVIFALPPITYEITASFFVDADIIFVPMSVRALGTPDQMLRNEVRRKR